MRVIAASFLLTKVHFLNVEGQIDILKHSGKMMLCITPVSLYFFKATSSSRRRFWHFQQLSCITFDKAEKIAPSKLLVVTDLENAAILLGISSLSLYKMFTRRAIKNKFGTLEVTCSTFTVRIFFTLFPPCESLL